ncbi:MAG: PAS domain S-box protein [Bradyrhizobium sp.]|uniref:sensor histidine kinase n=1 Tax=Bradyrhizobium sp. TaxID=376 RepID=UPI001C2933CF|nr:PAS domain-containing protein [Bradyrhizobium sp.]MBU6463057.1 PAS domain-containing sensor histidine kinase [Pseudomonadota bacterium]MDE2069257.1 PAS domain S-box protein [Bradyrhizobium sp.]MDE2242240.1 PAS domain S-box protein [Bradyrhizobium sp.]MDE2468549.1 PAS domain S-box protein [Bradyrhizobium sp.]
MNHPEFQLRGLSDPRLAVHATSALPTWLWSTDGTRILWANPVGARLFGAANSAALAAKIFGPADPHRRQVVQLANSLPPGGAIRLERLRGFGAPLGQSVSCGCARLDFTDGSHGILIVADADADGSMPLAERLQRLVEGIETPIAAFAGDGMFLGASDAAQSLPDFRDLFEAGLKQSRNEALKHGRAEPPIGNGRLVLQRVGSGADVGLVALVATGAAPSDQVPGITAADEARAESIPGDKSAEPLAEGTEAAPVQPAPVNDDRPHEPSPYVEAAVDESASSVPDFEQSASALGHNENPSPQTSSWLDEPVPATRKLPLRFVWQMDAEGHFSLGSDEFTHLIGARTMAGFGRLWSDIAETFGLDPDGRVLKAVATRNTWSGITLNWPTDGGGRLSVELSGLPVYDSARNFAGYRGFGVCRDLDALARLDALRRHELAGGPAPQALSADIVPPDMAAKILFSAAEAAPFVWPKLINSEDSQPTDLETPEESFKESSGESSSEIAQETPKNVLPFRPINESRTPLLTPVENRTFHELARQLAERLEKVRPTALPPADAREASAAAVTDQPVPLKKPEIASQPPSWLAPPEPPARGEARDRTLLDLLPIGVLIYRLDRLLYANSAFLQRMGYADLQALEDAGGLDALYVEPSVSGASSRSDSGKPVTISATQDPREQVLPATTDAQLYTISWDGASALALIFSNAANADIPAVLEVPSPVGHAKAEELGAILDTTAEGILMFDAEGNINSANRGAEALFGHHGAELVQRNLIDLFAPESAQVVKDYLESVKSAEFASPLEQGRDVLARVRGGGLIPVSMTMGRTRPTGPNFFVVFRDLSQAKKSESELREAQRLADRAANAKADMLARISHEVRTPLDTIIGSAEVMIGQRFGTLGNERYVAYLKDIRASSERVIALISDLLDISRIESGKLDLAFTSLNLNELVEQCVAVMQPQANRERVIIRTSLTHVLPQVTADPRVLREVTLNLIGNSIYLANAGGQVIVSTALSDLGGVVLRVRDTGQGLNDNEVAAAMDPFRTPAPSDQSADNAGINLSLTKALVEANRARFQVKAGGHPSTLIEVLFPHAMEQA